MPINIPMRYENQKLLWSVEDVYSADECARFIDLIERSSPALATNNPLYRDQDRVIKDDPEIAAELFRRLRPNLPDQMGSLRLVGLNERLRFYRYHSGQRFDPHMDHWYRPIEYQITLHSILVYFNDNFEGGETRFQEQIEQTVVPKPGLAAIFQHKIRHEGCQVRSATKYAMRTDVVYESPEPIGETGGL